MLAAYRDRHMGHVSVHLTLLNFLKEQDVDQENALHIFRQRGLFLSFNPCTLLSQFVVNEWSTRSQYLLIFPFIFFFLHLHLFYLLFFLLLPISVALSLLSVAFILFSFQNSGEGEAVFQSPKYKYPENNFLCQSFVRYS